MKVGQDLCTSAEGEESEAGLRNMKGAARRKRDKLSSSKRKGRRARLLRFKLLFPAELIKIVARYGRRKEDIFIPRRKREKVREYGRWEWKK